MKKKKDWIVYEKDKRKKEHEKETKKKNRIKKEEERKEKGIKKSWAKKKWKTALQMEKESKSLGMLNEEKLNDIEEYVRKGWIINNEITLSPKQKLFFKEFKDNEKLNTLLVWWWANGGKTYGVVIMIILTCLKYSGISWAVWRQTLKAVKNGFWKTLLNMMTKFGLKEWELWPNNTVNKGHYYYNKTTSTIRFINWSEIQMLGLAKKPNDENFEWLSWYEFTYAYIDEVQDWIDEKVIDVLLTRVWRVGYKETIKEKINGVIQTYTQEKQPKGKIIMSCNPKNWWVKNRYYIPYRDWKEDVRHKFIQILYKDNIFIDQKQYAESVMSTGNEVIIQKKLFWNWDYDDVKGKLYKSDDIMWIFTDRMVLDDDLTDEEKRWVELWLWAWKVITIDPSWKWDDRAVFFVWDWLNIIDNVVFEWEVSGWTIKKACKELQEKHGIPNQRVVIDGNVIGSAIADLIDEYDKDKIKRFIAQGKEERYKQETGRDENNGRSNTYVNLRSQCFYMLKHIIKSIKIEDKKLIWNYKQEIFDDLDILCEIESSNESIGVSSKKEIKEQLVRSTDFWDCFSFFMYYLILAEKNKNKKDFYYWGFRI